MKIKKQVLKCAVSLLVILSMIISPFANIRVTAETNGLTSSETTDITATTNTVEAVSGDAISVGNKKFIGDGFDIDFSIDSKWKDAFNGTITITNTSDTVIDNWKLEFNFNYNITNIWNAAIQSQVGSKYIIKNATWNQDIPVGGSVSFGFCADCDGTIQLPTSYSIPVAQQDVLDDYEITYQVYTDWGSGFNAQISIKNNSAEVIEDWSLEFDFARNITNFWSASMVSHEGNHYIIKNAGYNANIKPGETLILGFGGDSGIKTDEPTNYSLHQIGEIIETSSDELLVTENGLMVTAYGEYSTAANTIDLSWSSTYENGEFEIQKLSNNTFETIDTVQNNNSYAYTIALDETMIFRIKETDVRGNVAISNDVTMEYNSEYGTYTFTCLDSDTDGLYDYIEEQLETDLNVSDTDGDGLSDYIEVVSLNLNPLLKDSDLNGIDDGDTDVDADGLTILQEFEIGSDPKLADTDVDGLSDSAEVTLGTSPLLTDTDEDSISDYMETQIGTNPLVVDTDGDGTNDGDEVFSYVASSSATENKVKAQLDISANGAQLSTLEVTSLSESALFDSTIVGYIGSAYDFSMEGSFDSAVLTMTYDEAANTDEEFVPAIYYYNETTQTLEYVEGQTITGNKVTATLQHFSTYILLNKTAVDQLWSEEIKGTLETEVTTGLDVTFAIDISGSMDESDPTNCRKSILENFIDESGDSDRIAVVTYDHYAYIINNGNFAQTREEKETLKTAIPRYFGTGGTNSSLALYCALAYHNNDTQNAKCIILITDGYDNNQSYYYSDLLSYAVQQNIKIYTIGLGSNADNSLLKAIAINTGATYYYAENSSELVEQFAKIEEDVELLNDTDHDGLCDYYEQHLRISTGYINTDPENPDTDGDGILDGDEVIPVYNTNGTVNRFKLISYPNKPDSDLDDMWDNEDTDPLVPWKRAQVIGRTVYNAEFSYSDKNFIYSRLFAGQRDLGFCYAYDEGIVVIDSLLDCEPIYFHYDNKEWMIELWKGQYGIETGGEVGVYYRELDDPAISTMLNSNKTVAVKTLRTEMQKDNLPEWLINLITGAASSVIEDITVDNVDSCADKIDDLIIEINSILDKASAVVDVSEAKRDMATFLTGFRNLLLSFNSKLYKSVAPEDELMISFELQENGATLLTRGPQNHWWLTGFQWGNFAEPDDLKMNIKIEFKNSDMLEAFLNGQSTNDKNNYPSSVIIRQDRNNDNNGEYGLLNITDSSGKNGKLYKGKYSKSEKTVSFKFDKPLSAQPYMQSLMYAPVKASTSTLVTSYNGLKFVLGCTSNDPNVLQQKIDKALRMIDITSDVATITKTELYERMYNKFPQRLQSNYKLWFGFNGNLTAYYQDKYQECLKKSLVEEIDKFIVSISEMTQGFFTVAGQACSSKSKKYYRY